MQRLEVNSHGCLFCERRVPPLFAEKLHVPLNAQKRFLTVGVSVQINLLVFQASPESFHEDVVEAASFAIHRNLNATRQQKAGEFFARELDALVGIEDFWLAVPGQRFFKRVDAEADVEGYSTGATTTAPSSTSR